MANICRLIARRKPPCRLVTLQEAIERLGISRSSLYRLIKANPRIKPITINNRIKGWRENDFEQFIQQLR